MSKLKSSLGIIKNKLFYMKYNDIVNELEVQNHRNRYQGKRVFLIGSGPSLADVDLSLLKNEITMGMNLSYKHYKANFHLVANSNVLKRYGYDVLRNKELFLTGSASRYYLKNKDIFSIDNNIFIIPDYGEIQVWKNIKKDILKQGVRGGYNISLIALQILAYMGFKEIYLLGHDCNYTNKTMPFYTYDLNGKRKKKSGDPNRHWPIVFKNYDILKKELENQNIKIYNCTPNSNLKIFTNKKIENVI